MNRTTASYLRTLAALMRSGLTLRQALMRWPDHVDRPPAELRDIAQRVALGAPAVAALAATSLESQLAITFRLHLSDGIDLARWLDDAADHLERELAAAESARAASAGAVLSARMVAGLPLLFIPLVPMRRGAMLDPVGIAILALGIALACAGLKWISRLVPPPPSRDRVGQVCLSTAALLDAGLGLAAALEGAASDLRSGILGAPDPRRLVRLGWPWHEALAKADPAFQSVRDAIDQAREHGLPLARSLRVLEERRRAERLRDFEGRLKRAPVLMVVPLTCCVLPAYGLLGVAPFLRSMTLG